MAQPAADLHGVSQALDSKHVGGFSHGVIVCLTLRTIEIININSPFFLLTSGCFFAPVVAVIILQFKI